MEDFQVISDILFKYREQFADKDFLEINNRIKKIHDKFPVQIDVPDPNVSSYSNSSVSSATESDEESVRPNSRLQYIPLIRPRRVTTECFRQFILDNWQVLLDDSNNPIITQLEYDSDGNIMINLKSALKMIFLYSRNNNLIHANNRIKIRMDQTLKELFPDYVEKRDDNGVIIKEEDFRFYYINRGIKKHLSN